MSKKVILLLICIPVWIITFLVSYFFSSDDAPANHPTYVVSSTLIFALWLLGSFYGFYSYLIPNYLEKKKVLTFWVYAVLFILVVMPVIVLSLTLLTNVSPLTISDVFTKEGFFVWLGISAGTLICGILGSFYRFSIDWFYNLQLKKELENVKLQSELDAIKSRLNPHFLFNTLNNIDTLIQTSPATASVALSKLSDLLRCVVYETGNEKIPVQKELDNVKRYIDLEKLRLLNPESVAFKNSIVSEFLIPPMIFMPFIENAFKYSNLNNPGQKIDISFSEIDNTLWFQCVNIIATRKNEPEEKGVGMELIKKRLKLIYADKHKLSIEQHNNEYNVLLRIDFTDDLLHNHRR